MSSSLSPHLVSPAQKIAVGVSGGPDSMALCHFLSTHPARPQILALSVDHGLRTESGLEAKQVGNWLYQWPQVSHYILAWQTDTPPQSRILEAARAARYRLFSDFCHDHEVGELYLGHHLDDQAETFLFRLAKGSGLDGLGAMHRRQEFNSCLTLHRPFLSISKKELIKYCKEHAIPYFNDPTNENPNYARPRLRQSMEILAQEGLTPQRLGKTAERLRRARRALEQIVDQQAAHIIEPSDNGFTYRIHPAKDLPEEIGLRLLQTSIELCKTDTPYPPRLEKLEDLHHQVMNVRPFRKQTLAGIIFEMKTKNGEEILHLSPETC
jgi:tRNA(Ile)-lysidine synthase